jgi:hypothetical protein
MQRAASSAIALAQRVEALIFGKAENNNKDPPQQWE